MDYLEIEVSADLDGSGVMVQKGSARHGGPIVIHHCADDAEAAKLVKKILVDARKCKETSKALHDELEKLKQDKQDTFSRECEEDHETSRKYQAERDEIDQQIKAVNSKLTAMKSQS